MADTGGSARGTRTMWLGVVALCLVQFVDVLGVTVMVTALPTMLSNLHASPDAASLISTGYAMFFAGLLLFGARLGDRFGHRRIIMTGLAIFSLAATVGATATSVAVLTAARCMQGAAAALSVPSALRLLTTITPDDLSVSGPAERWHLHRRRDGVRRRDFCRDPGLLLAVAGPGRPAWCRRMTGR